jgi:C1A family cysteine protease
MFTEPPSAKCYSDAFKYKALAYHRVAPKDIKEVLAAGKPVLIGMSVYASFENPEVAETGQVPMPKRREQLMGGHAVLVVGYEQKEYIIRNSWGEDWGDNGYFYLPQEYLSNPSLASDFWTLIKVE